MDFDGNGVVALLEEGGVEFHGSSVGVGLGVCGREGVERYLPCGHVISACFFSVDIDDETVVGHE